MSNLKVFESQEFGEIRTIEEDGKVLFCAKDVASALGYKNTRDAINRHCKGVVKRDGVSIPKRRRKPLDLSIGSVKIPLLKK